MRSRKPLLVDLYSGLGGWAEGGLAEGYDVVGFDIEQHVYGEHRYPGQLVIQDVRTLHGRQLASANLIVASPPCFVAGTLILTSRGMLPIPDVLPGDMVLTHRRRWRRVLRTGSTIAATVIASGYGGRLEGTAEHPIYVRRDEGSFWTWGKKEKHSVYTPKRLGHPSWVPLGNIASHHWATPSGFDPLPTPDLPRGLPNTAEFWWMVGRWIGDGWVRLREKSKSGDSVIICCGHREADELEERLNSYSPRKGNRVRLGELNWFRVDERTATKFISYSNSLAHWLITNFGRGAAQKSWPAWVFGMLEEHRHALLDGYASADGYEGENSGARVIKASSVSKKLAIGTRLLAQSLGYPASVFFTKRPETCKIEGRVVQQRDTWSANWMPDSNGHRLAENADGFFWGKVRDVRPAQESARVWNLEVDEDNSYLADGIVVHNCQEFSWMAMPWSRAKQVAAALRGEAEFPEGYRGSRTIADLTALFDACFRIQREASDAAGRHIPMIVENVKGAQPWVGRARWLYGSFALWGDVPALMPITRGSKVPVDLPPLSGHADPRRGRKNTGGSWFNVAHNTTSGKGQNPDGRFLRKDGTPHMHQLLEAREGAKSVGSGPAWWRQGPGGLPSKSNARKMASALIAKIPLALSTHIARTFYPKDGHP